MNNNNFLIHKINLISTFYCIIIFFSNHGKYMQTYYNTTQKNNASYHNEDHVQILLWTQTYTCILFYFVWFFFGGGCILAPAHWYYISLKLLLYQLVWDIPVVGRVQLKLLLSSGAPSCVFHTTGKMKNISKWLFLPLECMPHPQALDLKTIFL